MYFAEDKVPAVDFRFQLIIGLFSDEEKELKSMSRKKGKEKFKAKKKLLNKNGVEVLLWFRFEILSKRNGEQVEKQ